VGLFTGCEEDNGIEPPTGIGAQVNAIRVTIGAQNVTVFKDGKITLAPLSFIRPNVPVTTTLLDDQGNPINGVTEAQLRVNMGPSQSNLNGFAFTRTTAFAGTLASTAAGTANFAVSLFDTVKRRTIFGPYHIPVVVR
jgi:hypothetical protein